MSTITLVSDLNSHTQTVLHAWVNENVVKKGIDAKAIAVTVANGYAFEDVLLQDDDDNRGWLREGESAADIRWEHENNDGWPESVSLPEEEPSKYS